jgi:hypothetical protein
MVFFEELDEKKYTDNRDISSDILSTVPPPRTRPWVKHSPLLGTLLSPTEGHSKIKQLKSNKIKVLARFTGPQTSNPDNTKIGAGICGWIGWRIIM